MGMKQANILPFYTPTTPGWGKNVMAIFSEDNVAYQNTRDLKLFSKCITFMPSKRQRNTYILDNGNMVEI